MVNFSPQLSTQLHEVERPRCGTFNHSSFHGGSFSDSDVAVNDGFQNQTGTEELFHLLADNPVQVLGLRFILHLLSPCSNNPSRTLAFVESEALVLDRGIWSGVLMEALVGVVVGNTLQ